MAVLPAVVVLIVWTPGLNDVEPPKLLLIVLVATACLGGPTGCRLGHSGRGDARLGARVEALLLWEHRPAVRCGGASWGSCCSAAVGLAALGAGLAGVGPLSRISVDIGTRLRGHYWHAALSMAGDNPLVGVGPGRFHHVGPARHCRGLAAVDAGYLFQSLVSIDMQSLVILHPMTAGVLAGAAGTVRWRPVPVRVPGAVRPRAAAAGVVEVATALFEEVLEAEPHHPDLRRSTPSSSGPTDRCRTLSP